MTPAGEYVATSSFDGMTRLSETLTGRTLAAVPGTAWNLAFSSDGRYLGPGRLGRTTNCIFEVVRPTGFQRLAAAVPIIGVQKVHTMDFSPDGRLVAAAAWDGVHLWDRSQNRLLARLPTGGTFSVLFDPDGSALLVTAGGELWRWPLQYDPEVGGTNILSIGPPQSISPGGGAWSSAVLHAQNDNLAVVSQNRRGAITNLRHPTNWLRLETIHAHATYIDLSSDGRFAATGTWRGKDVCIWDVTTGRLLHRHPNKGQAAVAFSRDGHWLMVGGEEYHALPVGHWTNWHRLESPVGERPIGLMTFSPDGRLWARMKTVTSYELVEPGTWRIVAVLQSPYPMGLGWPRFSPDGTLLAAADTSLGVQIWDLRELRAALRPMGLDWDHPEYAIPETNALARPLAVRVLSNP
jgi:WD40 repeat protein